MHLALTFVLRSQLDVYYYGQALKNLPQLVSVTLQNNNLTRVPQGLRENLPRLQSLRYIRSTDPSCSSPSGTLHTYPNCST